jgi:DNA-binding transcriptional regulator YiaG
MIGKPLDGHQVAKLRRALGLSQVEFWTRLGMTQSGGSRYERGQPISRPTQLLIRLVYGRKPQTLLAQLRCR